MTQRLQHGSIIGGVVTIPDLGSALADYRDRLGMVLIEAGPLSADLAASWGCPGSAGANMAVLQPASGAHCFVRLIEQPGHVDFKPTTSFGWAAFELTVQDVFGWPKRLELSGFDIVGPPKEIASLPYFVPMQVLGQGGEMIYLNEVREDTPSSDLPKALSLTDFIFIVILAASDREAAVNWYVERLQLDECDTYTIPYGVINQAFGFAEDTLTDLTMIQNDRLPIVEIDSYPAQATQRPRRAGMLPPGNALVSLAVTSLDVLDMQWITPPVSRAEAPYCGHRAATTIGPAGELLELIEL